MARKSSAKRLKKKAVVQTGKRKIMKWDCTSNSILNYAGKMFTEVTEQ